MWIYEKKLQYPVNISRKDIKSAKILLSQLGGADGEMGAALRYLSQRYTMPWPSLKALLTDIGTEELAHVEIISALIYQLMEDANIEELKEAGMDAYFVDHTLGIYPQSAAGIAFNAQYFQSKGDPITDLCEDMAAEQKARTTYDNILRLVKNEEVCEVIRFLRQREIVHYQRFAEGLEFVKEQLNRENYYEDNPSFDSNKSS